METLKNYVNWKLAHSDKVATAEGYPLVMENCKANKRMKQLQVYGDCFQSQTPSPDNPSEIQSVGDLITDTGSEYYGKYKIPIIIRGKNLLPNSDWMSGAHLDGFTEQTEVDYITEYTQNSISFNLGAWRGVSSPRFKKDSVKRIMFKINQNQINSDDEYINFYIMIQGYDDNNNKIGKLGIQNNAVADTEYIFDISAISSYNWYINSTQFSFCILARNNPLSNLMVYDIAYYADTDTTEYEPYIEPVTQNIYLDEPLRKVGDYADYIDFKNKKVYRIIDRIELLPDDVYKTYTYGVNHGFLFLSLIKDSGTLRRNYYSNRTSGVKVSPTTQTLTFWLGIGGAGTRNIYWVGVSDYLQIYDNSKSDDEMIAEFKEWLSQNPTYVLYPLMTPIEEDISCQLPKILAKTTIIEGDTSLLPSNIKGKYVIK